MLVLHTLPAGVLSLRLRARAESSDDAERSARVGPANGFIVLLGLSVLTGGWAAGLGGFAFGLSDPYLVSASEDYDLSFSEIVLGAIEFAVSVLGLGHALGFFAGIFVGALAAETRLDRSVPLIFLPPLVMAAVASAVDPFLGILNAGVALLVTSVVARRYCSMKPAGSCQKCGYDLVGLSARVCPECGRSNASTAMPVGRE